MSVFSRKKFVLFCQQNLYVGQKDVYILQTDAHVIKIVRFR